MTLPFRGMVGKGAKTMTKTQVQIAITEATRFIHAAKIAIAKAAKIDGPDMWACKENATVKRASMDLTRALADMRKTQ